MSGIVRLAVVGVLIAAGYSFFSCCLHSNLPIHVDGEVTKDYERVRTAFRQNFEDGWEREGAALAVFVKGKKVADLWGGYADASAMRKWQKDTMTLVFSSTKAVGALAIAMLVDRGLLNYDDLVTKYWPEFGQNGKDNITVQWIMSHTAGLAYFAHEVTVEEALDHRLMSKVIEKERPLWPPGTKTGYHAITYGWLVDQIIRRVDPKKRGVGDFMREEITGPNNIDFHIGLPKELQARVARVSLPNFVDSLREGWADYRTLFIYAYLEGKARFDPLYRSVLRGISWFQIIDRLTVNNPDYHRMEQVGSLGIGGARGLGEIFALMTEGKFLSKATLKLLAKPYIAEADAVLGAPITKGNGMFFQPCPGKTDPNDQMCFGHPGYGCQNLIVDLERQLVISYVTNGLKNGGGDLCPPYARLKEAIYMAFDKGQGLI